MYNVGFGDCFLLSFTYSKSTTLHVLVDYGSVSAPGRSKKKNDFMKRIAEDIAKVTGGKLEGVIATHRHRDHVSGFSTDTGTGKTIAALNPKFVVQPWTEDPRAKKDAVTATSSSYTGGKADPQKMTLHFLGTLEDMHSLAASIAELAKRKTLAGAQALQQMSIIGMDNIKNPSAVKNLIAMGQKGKAYYVNAGMTLNSLLPGVKMTVLGPPTLKQSDAIRKERAKDPANFWQFRSFWATQSLSFARSVHPGTTLRKSTLKRDPPPIARWFVNQSRQIQADQMLSIVRDLDKVMNNTSVILLIEFGPHKILFPGDAQIENWAYALANPKWKAELGSVSLYKVGHHGSLNATPKPLWDLFKNKGGAKKPHRLETLCSTKAGVYGSTKSGTEVPRKPLVEELEKNSAFSSTEESENSFCHITEIA
jgi:hypothetical protein